MRGLGAVVGKDARLMFRNPGVAIVQVLIPLMIILFVSYGLEELLSSDSQLDLVVVDLDHSIVSTRLVDNLKKETLVRVHSWDKGDVSSENAAEILAAERGSALLVVPGGYSPRETPSGLRLYADPKHRTAATLLRQIVESSLLQQRSGGSVGLTEEPAGRLLLVQSLPQSHQLPSAYEQTVPGVQGSHSCLHSTSRHWFVRGSRSSGSCWALGRDRYPCRSVGQRWSLE
jgi:hypothetical protein